MMRAHYLQHVPFEDLGSIENWLKRTGYEITSTSLYESEELPGIESVDLLVIMGGPMSVNDDQDFPWLVEEKEFIKKVIESGKPVLGICLGAQLIACSLGAEVFSNSVKEIGWIPIRATDSNNQSVFLFPEETDVFHWHGETFNLPMGATRIAESAACENQAYQIGKHVIGLQFHLETTPVSAQAIVENCRDELIEGEYIQSAAEILSVPQEQYRSINSLMEDVLEYITRNDHPGE
ncbi:MAG: gamma-glutamyl-gamma-aminobutyrate hydrolase family protein [Candidatus Thiodiazotropha endolucinida]|nr:gamma-glutamyl-gamma-aminobutyrate hydrolase family protein [Candidatus Thiodiazotropha endolucinida]